MSKGERTRQRIVELAAPLFNKHGIDGCSMQEIMAATGLEKGGLYRHFASKEELAAAAFTYARHQAVKTRTDGLEPLGSSVDQLRYLIHRFVSTPSPLPGGCPLLNTAVYADDGNPRLRQLVTEAFADWRVRLASIVRRGIDAGELRADLVPEQVANTIVGLLEGTLLLGRLDGDRSALQSAEESLLQLLTLWKA